MLVRYPGRIARFVGSTPYELAPDLLRRPAGDIDRRRVTAVCEWALEVRRLTGREPGRLRHGEPRRRNPA